MPAATSFISVDLLEDLFIEEAEHRAYRECIQFEGDECRTCAAFDAQIAELDAALTRFDCDCCGHLVALRTPPHLLPLVLCADCNGGTAIN